MSARWWTISIRSRWRIPGVTPTRGWTPCSGSVASIVGNTNGTPRHQIASAVVDAIAATDPAVQVPAPDCDALGRRPLRHRALVLLRRAHRGTGRPSLIPCHDHAPRAAVRHDHRLSDPDVRRSGSPAGHRPAAGVGSLPGARRSVARSRDPGRSITIRPPRCTRLEQSLAQQADRRRARRGRSAGGPGRARGLALRRALALGWRRRGQPPQTARARAVPRRRACRCRGSRSSSPARIRAISIRRFPASSSRSCSPPAAA